MLSVDPFFKVIMLWVSKFVGREKSVLPYNSCSCGSVKWLHYCIFYLDVKFTELNLGDDESSVQSNE